MSRDQFILDHEAEWSEVQYLLEALEAGRSTDSVDRFPGLYRKICRDLALVRSRQYGSDLEARLHPLVLRGHQQLYQSRRFQWKSVETLLVEGFPRLVREELSLVLVCTALFVLPALAICFWVLQQGEVIYSLLEAEQVQEFEEMYRVDGDSGRDSESDVLMFGFYLYNNIGIAFRTFATGIFVGIGSVFVLVFNGLFFGGVTGHIINSGSSSGFFPFIVGHCSFELTAIVLAGVAGTRMGFSLVAPGYRSRGRALVFQARRLVPMIWGITILLVLAAFVEAFWSSSSAPSSLRYSVGAVLWVAVFAYFGLAGRRA